MGGKQSKAKLKQKKRNQTSAVRGGDPAFDTLRKTISALPIALDRPKELQIDRQGANDWSVARGERTLWSDVFKLGIKLATSHPEQETPVQLLKSCIRGDYNDLKRLPRVESPEMLVFVSSTFTDTQRERDTLIQDVYPYLENVGRTLGIDFHPIELRWGVNESLQDEEGILSICLRNVQRCATRGSGLSFVYLGTDKYGYIPLPLSLDDSLFQFAISVMPRAQGEVLKSFYELDKNSKPESYTLIPSFPLSISFEGFKVLVSMFDDAKVRKAETSDLDLHSFYHEVGSKMVLNEVPDRVRSLLGKLLGFIHRQLRQTVLEQLPDLQGQEKWMSSRNDKETVLLHRIKIAFGSSVTEHEVRAGILDREVDLDRVFLFDRRIGDLEGQLKQGKENQSEVMSRAPNFVDMIQVNEDGFEIESPAQNSLHVLKDQVRSRLVKKESRAVTYDVSLEDVLQAERDSHIRKFADDFCAVVLSSLFRTCMERASYKDKRLPDIVSHLSLLRNDSMLNIPIESMKGLTTNFREFVSSVHRGTAALKAFPIQGSSGSGKSVLLASMLVSAMEDYDDKIRFIFRSSSLNKNASSILVSIAQQLYALNSTNGIEVGLQPDSGSFQESLQLFNAAVAGVKKTAQPVIIAIDGLDHLDENCKSLTEIDFGADTSVFLVYTYTNSDAVDAISNSNANQIPKMNHKVALDHLQGRLEALGRTLQENQIVPVSQLFKKMDGVLPFDVTMLLEIVKLWKSTTPVASFDLQEYRGKRVLKDNDSLGETRGMLETPESPREEARPEMISSILLNSVESKLNPLVVKTVIRLLLLSRDGLTSSEIEDIISLDDKVLDSIFEWWIPPVRRCPTLIVAQILDDLNGVFQEQQVFGSKKLVWSIPNEPLAREASARYQDEENDKYLSNSLMEYFSGKFANGKEYKGNLENRYIDPQDLVEPKLKAQLLQRPQGITVSSEFNSRKLREYPFHLAATRNWEELIKFIVSVDVLQIQLVLHQLLFDDSTSFFHKCCTNYQGKPYVVARMEHYIQLDIASRDGFRRSRGMSETNASIALANDKEVVVKFLKELSVFQPALKLQEEVTNLRRKHESNDPIALANSIELLNNLKYRLDIEVATPEEEGAIDVEPIRLYQRFYGEKVDTLPRYATILANLAATYSAKYRMSKKNKNVPEAENHLLQCKSLREKSLEIRLRVLGEIHPDTAKAYSGLAIVMRNSGQSEAALALGEKALKIREQIFGKSHPEVATSLISLANTSARMSSSNLNQEAYLVRAVRIRLKSLGRQHAKTALSFVSLARYHVRNGNYVVGASLYELAAKTTVLIQNNTTNPDYVTAATGCTNAWRAHLQSDSAEKLKLEELLRKNLPARDTKVIEEIQDICLNSRSLLLMNLQLHFDSSIVPVGGVSVSEMPTESSRDEPEMCRLNKLLGPSSLSREEVTKLWNVVASKMKPIAKRFGDNTRSIPVVVTSPHNISFYRTVRTRTKHKSREVFTNVIASRLGKAMNGTTLQWPTSEVVRATQSLFPHPNQEDPNYLHPERVPKDPWFLALKEEMGNISLRNKLPFHIDIHGMKNWADPVTQLPGGVAIGTGAMEKVATTAVAKKRCNAFKITLVSEFNKLLKGFTSKLDDFFAGAGRDHYDTVTNQCMRICDGEGISVQLEISLELRTVLAADPWMLNLLAQALKNAYFTAVSVE